MNSGYSPKGKKKEIKEKDCLLEDISLKAFRLGWKEVGENNANRQSGDKVVEYRWTITIRIKIIIIIIND